MSAFGERENQSIWGNLFNSLSSQLILSFFPNNSNKIRPTNSHIHSLTSFDDMVLSFQRFFQTFGSQSNKLFKELLLSIICALLEAVTGYFREVFSFSILEEFVPGASKFFREGLGYFKTKKWITCKYYLLSTDSRLVGY